MVEFLLISYFAIGLLFGLFGVFKLIYEVKITETIILEPKGDKYMYYLLAPVLLIFAATWPVWIFGGKRALQ